MEQPMAVDLRFILAVTKINAHLERVGDATSSISDRIRDLEAFPPVDLPEDILRMAAGRDKPQNLLQTQLHSFVHADLESSA